MPADVLLWRLPVLPGSELVPADPRPGLRRLVEGLGLGGAAGRGGGWALKVQIGSPGRPAAIAPSWALEVAASLSGPAGTAPAAGSFAFDTLSISTRGLDSTTSLLQVAAAKGFGAGAGSPAGSLPFVVGGDPEGPPTMPIAGLPGSGPAGHEMIGGLGVAGGLAMLAPLRPHPHLGVSGAVAGLGLDLASREAKLKLHKGIRPQVDTPLCAGCGSCLDVCLYDAIVIRGGRATIDHRLCTGCGECMGVCFMAGIGPEEAGGREAFQFDVAAAAVATARQVRGRWEHPVLYMNFMIHLDSHATAARARRRAPLVGIGVLASLDPVALDTAALALLSERLGGDLTQWSGFAQGPARLLEHAEALGLGSRSYRQREV